MWAVVGTVGANRSHEGDFTNDDQKDVTLGSLGYDLRVCICTCVMSSEAASHRVFGECPRGLSRAQAATYCGCSVSAFDDWVRRGIVPGAIPGTHRWDRKAIDDALDRASGLQTTVPASSALEQWKANRAGKP